MRLKEHQKAGGPTCRPLIGHKENDLSTARFRADFNAVRLAFVKHNETPRITGVLTEQHFYWMVDT